MAYRPVLAVEIWLWGNRVGAVAPDPASGFYAFEYDKTFPPLGIEVAPIHLPRSIDRVTIFPGLPPETFRRLPAFVADVLPDDFGNALINAYMASNGVRATDITPLDRLAYMGARAFGALEFKPARTTSRPNATAIHISTLVDSARRAVAGEFSTDDLSRAALMQIIQVGTSAGGARAKAAIAWNRTSGELRAGQFAVPKGFEHWLLKFDGMGPDAGATPAATLGPGGHYGRIEYAYHLMASAANIQMSECRLLEENGRAHFMTRRFDRDGNNKLHIQSLCAMAHLDYRLKGVHSYEQLFDTMHALELPSEDFSEAFRRMVFNYVTANCDDHTKNHAFRLKPGEQWRLAPAYDLTHSYSSSSEWVNQHLMSVNGKFSGVTRDDCLTLADRFGIAGASALIAGVLKAANRWPEFAQVAGVTEARARAVQADFCEKPFRN